MDVLSPSLMLDIFVSLNFLKHKDVNYMEAIQDNILKKLENLSTNQLIILIISSGLKKNIKILLQ